MHLSDPRTYGVAVMLGLGAASAAIQLAKFLSWQARRR